MVALPPCPDTTWQILVGLQFNDPPTGYTNAPFFQPANAPLQPSLIVTARYQNTGATLLAGFVADIHLLAGPAPYVRQQTLIHLAAPLTLDQDLSVSIPVNVTMSPAGRAFNYATDRFGVTMNTNYTTGGVDGIQSIGVRVCESSGVADCCAETLAKLDQIISYIAAPLHNQR